MPFEPGVSGITDVYHSGNVYINNVLVATWQPPGQSAAFAGSTPTAALSFSPETQAVLNNYSTSYVANPTDTTNGAAGAAGVKGNYNPPPEVGSDTPIPANSNASASDIVPFLSKVLEEAKRGMWRESGQGGRASNPNIVGIWRDLGIGTTGCWATDQTAWCAGFVNFALKNSGYKYYQIAGARQTAAKFQQVPAAQVQPGDIALWSFSHVNFVYTRGGNKVTFVGGNQTPSSGKNNNPSDGDVTISWPGGFDLSKGGVTFHRPVR